MNVKLPAGYPKWNDEPNFRAWLRNNYGQKAFDQNLEFVTDKVPRKPDESTWEWLVRLADEPVWSQALFQYPAFDTEVTNVRFSSEHRINAQILHYADMRAYYDQLGLFMAMRLKYAVRQGWVREQKNVTSKSRYGIGYVVRNGVHALLRHLGVESRFTIVLGGLAFYGTNTVLPTEAGRQAAIANQDIYRPHLPPGCPWTLHVNSLDGQIFGMAVPSNAMGAERIPNNATEPPLNWFRWQNYQAIVYARFDAEGTLTVRKWISPEWFMLYGIHAQAPEEEFAAAGFPNGYPKHLLNADGTRRVPCLGQVETRPFEKDDFDNVARIETVEQIYVSFQQMQPTVGLLERLKGFDPSGIRKAS